MYDRILVIILPENAVPMSDGVYSISQICVISGPRDVAHHSPDCSKPLMTLFAESYDMHERAAHIW